ncbi:MAG: hypothetical protein MJE68_13800 [Proteobacteria bacterium]|nr:hypothetical protein [Pseudomonadota bacterium]
MCRCDGEHIRYVTSKPVPATYTTTQQVATTLPLTRKPAPATTTQQVDQGAATTLPLTIPDPTDRMTTTIEMTTAEVIEIPTQIPV